MIGIGGLVVLALSGLRHRLLAWDLGSATSVFGHRLPALDVPGFDVPGFRADLSGIAAYLVIAGAVAVAVFVAADRIRPANAPNPDHRVILSALAGLIWPVLGIGLIQFAVMAVVKHLAVAVTPPEPDHLSDRHRLVGTR